MGNNRARTFRNRSRLPHLGQDRWRHGLGNGWWHGRLRHLEERQRYVCRHCHVDHLLDSARLLLRAEVHTQGTRGGDAAGVVEQCARSRVDPGHPELLRQRRPVQGLQQGQDGQGLLVGRLRRPRTAENPAARTATNATFWVDKGDAPPADVPQAITPEMLAQLAYAEIRVPSTKVDPRARRHHQGEPADLGVAGRREFQACLRHRRVPLLSIQATTTAEPVSLKIDPGTDDASHLPRLRRVPDQRGRLHRRALRQGQGRPRPRPAG